MREKQIYYFGSIIPRRNGIGALMKMKGAWRDGVCNSWFLLGLNQRCKRPTFVAASPSRKMTSPTYIHNKKRYYLSRLNPRVRRSSYTPSSMVTLRHQGFSPFSMNISSASPTCRLSDTSRLTWPLSLSRMALSARKLFAPLPLRASPRDGDPDPERISSLETQPPSLVTGNCY